MLYVAFYHAILYVSNLTEFIYWFNQMNPFWYWSILSGLVLGLLGFMFLSNLYISKINLFFYVGMTLTLCISIDVLVTEISTVSLYMWLLGSILFRLNPVKVEWMTIIFICVYIGVSYITSPTAWNYVNLIEDSALLGITSWICIQLRVFTLQIGRMREKNFYLIKKLKEAQVRIQEVNDEIEETYRRDYLTGLYNLGGFQDAVVRSLERISPSQSYHVVSIDLTDFKQINMREGVEFGDQVLITLAQQFKSKLPIYTHLARYDGDQFAIGLIGDHNYLRRCVETIDRVMSQVRTERININYCMGAASYPAETNNASELIRLAEKRLSIEQRRMRDKEEEKRRHMEKLSAVGQLAAGLAHEIRNPLTSIRGFVQISAAESTEVKKWESIILPEIDRINDLLKQFLNLSESRPARFQHFEVDQLIHDVYSLLMPKAMLMGHELTIEGPDTPILIEADPEKLKQVLINLVQNGLDALIQKGSVGIRWRVWNGRLSIRIEDTGVGIKPELLSRIYEPFFTTKDEGTGMGLAICHRIIQDHGGRLKVESRVGKGTIFHLYLPLVQGKSQIEDDEDEIDEDEEN